MMYFINSYDFLSTFDHTIRYCISYNEHLLHHTEAFEWLQEIHLH